MRKFYDRNDLKAPQFGLLEVKPEFSTVVFPTGNKITSPDCSILPHYAAATDIHAKLAKYRSGGSVCSSEMFLQQLSIEVNICLNFTGSSNQ